MFRWIPYPFVRIVVSFCAGTLIAIYQPGIIGERNAQLIFIACSILYVILALIRHKVKFNPGIVGLSAIFIAGYCNLLLQTDSRSPDHIIRAQTPIDYYTAVVTKPAEEKERSWKLESEISAIRSSQIWMPKRGKILLYVSKQDIPEPFHYGDVLLIRGKPQVVNAPANPGEFDYKTFLSFRNIYHQHFVRQGEVRYLENVPPSCIIKRAIAIRTWADNTLKKFIKGEREHALASALVLGVTDGLDNNLLNAYAATGAMHVLSVSGLHVGIIYWMILIICRPFLKIKHSKWLVAAISILVLWAYAFVTGICPSVLRAVTMFSFVAIARPWNHRTNIYNILAASAFCLLLYDPYMIMSVGFQLSYLAVLGIVTLQPALYRLWEPRQWYWDELWKVSAVSIAAQLSTFSLGLFYFHQFPNYFLLANLVVAPGSFLVLVSGVLLLLTSFVQPVAAVFGWTLKWIVMALNAIIFSIEKLPFSILDNIHISALQCFILVLLVSIFFLWVETKKFSLLIVISVLCSVFSIEQWNHYNKDVNVQKITIYNIPGHTAIDFMANGKSYFVGDTGIINDKLKTRFHIQPNRITGGVSSVLLDIPIRKQFEGCTMIIWRGKTILQITANEFWIPDKLEVDYLVISNNAIRDLSSIVGSVKARQIILDSSNSFYKADRIVSESLDQEIKVHSTLHHGAYYSTI